MKSQPFWLAFLQNSEFQMGIFKNKNQDSGKTPILKAAVKQVQQKVVEAAKNPALKNVAKVGAAIATGGVSLVADKKVQQKVKEVAKSPALKKVGKVALAVGTGGVSLLANKDNRQKIAQVAKKVATTAKTSAGKVANAGKKVASIALFLPLMPVAIVFLKRRGIKPEKDPEKLILQVYNEMSKKSFGLTEQGDEFDFAGGDVMEFGYADEVEVESYGVVPITPQMIILVVQFLKTIFDAIKAKKAAKQPLSPDEQQMMDAAPAIEEALTEAQQAAGEVLAQSQAEAGAIENQGAANALNVLNGGDPPSDGSGSDSDGIMSGNKKWIFIGLLIIVLFFLFLKFKK